MIIESNRQGIPSSLYEEICTTRPLSEEQIAQYNEDGFVIIPGFFDLKEVAPVLKAYEEDPELGGAWTRWADDNGKLNQIAVWTDLDNSLLGTIPRLARLVNAAEGLLGGMECYHWHSKLVVKPPHAEGWIEWHQGYGGWYNDCCLYPYFVTCSIAINENTKDNGCLQVVKKSHLLGRIDHKVFVEALVLDPVRMEKVLERLDVIYCELKPGDALFLHANTIHCSGGNRTDQHRATITTHYNAVSNEPFDLQGREHRRYRPLKKVADSAIVDGCYNSVFDKHVMMQQGKTFKHLIQYGVKSEK